MSDWTDAIVGDRMAVDREFNDRIASSQFTSQEWGLIMTATEFDIEDADDPDDACIVADTSKLPQIMPELDSIREGMAAMGGAPAQSGGTSGDGIVGKVKSALGLGGGSDGPDEEKLAAAEALAQEYADQLQAHLETNNKWDQIRIAYQE